ncbi:hypothetical protein ACH5RR_014804 [Cinchona calisaya]|uniref:RanBP2-type domain-containing protein n=1 Tax=Cinchona calisaya TaxID=153742 RepID=A0ABD2ZUU7_9GENT
MSWTCSVCTFINPSSSSKQQEKPTCQICLSSQPSSLSSQSPSPTKPKWACKACTFLNPYDDTSCQICGRRASASLLESLETDDDFDELASCVGNVFLPLRACNSSSKNKRKFGENPFGDADDLADSGGGFRGVKAANKEVQLMATETGSGKDHKPVKILSYNVWFQEDVEMHRRMEALSDLIQLHSPDIICFQEVTPNIYEVFQQFSWWKLYHCSVSNEEAFTRAYFCMQLCKLSVKSYNCKPFANSIMGRELCFAEVDVQAKKTLFVATSHLESPCPAPPKWDQMYSKERINQAKEAIKLLEKNPNVIFCGDMNWDDKLDGPFPLPDGWVDAWVQLRPSENGWTYDTKSNKMLSGNRTLQKRLDRFVCNLRDFKISEIEMIGMDEIPGLSYCKEKKVKKEVKKLMLPVLPSDHFGLLLTICPQ